MFSRTSMNEGLINQSINQSSLYSYILFTHKHASTLTHSHVMFRHGNCLSQNPQLKQFDILLSGSYLQRISAEREYGGKTNRKISDKQREASGSLQRIYFDELWGRFSPKTYVISGGGGGVWGFLQRISDELEKVISKKYLISAGGGGVGFFFLQRISDE